MTSVLVDTYLSHILRTNLHALPFEEAHDLDLISRFILLCSTQPQEIGKLATKLRELLGPRLQVVQERAVGFDVEVFCQESSPHIGPFGLFRPLVRCSKEGNAADVLRDPPSMLFASVLRRENCLSTDYFRAQPCQKHVEYIPVHIRVRQGYVHTG